MARNARRPTTPPRSTRKPTTSTLRFAVTVDIAIIGGGFDQGRHGGRTGRALQGGPGRDPSHRLGRQRVGGQVAAAACPATRRCISRCASGWAPGRGLHLAPAGAATEIIRYSGWTVRHRLRPPPWPPAEEMKASHMGGASQASYERRWRPCGIADRCSCWTRPRPAHLETELYSRRAEEHPQHAPAPAQPVHRRGQGGGRPRRADLRT